VTQTGNHNSFEPPAAQRGLAVTIFIIAILSLIAQLAFAASAGIDTYGYSTRMEQRLKILKALFDALPNIGFTLLGVWVGLRLMGSKDNFIGAHSNALFAFAAIVFIAIIVKISGLGENYMEFSWTSVRIYSRSFSSVFYIMFIGAWAAWLPPSRAWPTAMAIIGFIVALIFILNLGYSFLNVLTKTDSTNNISVSTFLVWFGYALTTIATVAWLIYLSFTSHPKRNLAAALIFGLGAIIAALTYIQRFPANIERLQEGEIFMVTLFALQTVSSIFSIFVFIGLAVLAYTPTPLQRNSENIDGVILT